MVKKWVSRDAKHDVPAKGVEAGSRDGQLFGEDLIEILHRREEAFPEAHFEDLLKIGHFFIGEHYIYDCRLSF